MFTNSRQSKGFSLVEVLVYLAIVILISVAAVSSLLGFSGSIARYRAEKELVSQVRSAFERIVADMRNATMVNVVSSTLDASPGTLVLEYPGETITYTLSSGALTVAHNGGSASPLTSGNVTVNALTFTQYDMTTTELVRVTLSATAVAGGATVSETFTTSAVLRGSYE